MKLCQFTFKATQYVCSRSVIHIGDICIFFVIREKVRSNNCQMLNYWNLNIEKRLHSKDTRQNPYEIRCGILYR